MVIKGLLWYPNNDLRQIQIRSASLGSASLANDTVTDPIKESHTAQWTCLG